MELASIQPIVLGALAVAMLLTAYEMRVSLRPAACAECPHCRAAAHEREQRKRDLDAWYANHNGLDGEDDDRRSR